VVVGVHTPEFGVEHDAERGCRAARWTSVRSRIDNDYAVWNALEPVLAGAVRRRRPLVGATTTFGEGGYDRRTRSAAARGCRRRRSPHRPCRRTSRHRAPRTGPTSAPERLRRVRTISGSSPEPVGFDEPASTPCRHRSAQPIGRSPARTLGRRRDRRRGGHCAPLPCTRPAPHPRPAPRRRRRSAARVRLDGGEPGGAHGLTSTVTATASPTPAAPAHPPARPDRGPSLRDRVPRSGAAALCFTFWLISDSRSLMTVCRSPTKS
jgi:hypothetical protein